LVHHLAGTLALVTRLLDLLHHRTKLAEHDLDTLPAARRAGLDGTLLPSSSLAGLADDRL
jgi:hypothetical protein